MNRKPLCLLLMLAMLGAGAAAAQTKLYRWVDKDGKVHYDDALPPEAVNQARREFNASTGHSTASVDRALTPEERAQKAAAEAAAAKAAAVEQGLKHQEDVMMATYASEADMSRAYSERIGLLRVTLESTEVSLRNLSENLAMLLSQASDAELDGRKVLEDRVKMIRDLHLEKTKQLDMQTARRADLAALTDEAQRMLARFRELQQARQAPATTPAPPPP